MRGLPPLSQTSEPGVDTWHKHYTENGQLYLKGVDVYRNE